MSNLHARGQPAPKRSHEAPFMSVLPTFLVTGVGTSAGFVTPQAAHTVLQRGSQQSAWGSSRRAAHSPNAEAERASLSPARAPRGMGLARSLDRPAARIRRLRTAEGGEDGHGRSLHCPRGRDGRRCICVRGALAPSTRRARTASSARQDSTLVAGPSSPPFEVRGRRASLFALRLQALV